MTDNSETVMGIYDAFGRGDVAHILDQMRDDVRWDHGVRDTGLPYLRTGTGRAHVEDFFVQLAQNLEFTTFEPGEPCASGDHVVVVVREAGRNLVTGAPVEDDLFVHLWTFDAEGKVAAFRHIGDLARHEVAARAEAPATAAS